jgi:hypothetical protein
MPGIFKEISITDYRNLKKDQIYQYWGTSWSVIAVTVYVLQDLNSSPTISTVDLQGMPI